MSYNFLLKNNLKNELKGLNNPTTEDIEKEKNDLLTEEMEALEQLKINTGNPKIVNFFLKIENIPANFNTEQFLVEHRKIAIKEVVDNYVKNCINANIVKPLKYSELSGDNFNEVKDLDLLLNLVNNYYDSIYARYTNFDKTKTLPDYNQTELDEMKYKAYKKIQKNTGIEAIQNDFNDQDDISFAEFAENRVNQYISEFNDNVKEKMKEQKINEEPREINVLNLPLEQKHVANLTTKVPLIYGMLKNSYNSRSRAERFFSYFPFVFPTATRERRALTYIETYVKKGCYLPMDKDDLNKLKINATNQVNDNFFKKEIEKVSYVDEKLNEKVNVEVNDGDLLIQNNEVVEPVNSNVNENEKDFKKDLIA